MEDVGTAHIHRQAHSLTHLYSYVHLHIQIKTQ